jgi:hypothetical protein
MIPHPLTASLRAGLTLVALAATLTGGSGCAHLTTFYNGVLLRAQTKHQLADVRQDTRQALAQQEQEAQRMQAQREIEQARLDAERRRLEAEFCAANQEALRRQVKRNIRETVESKVAFNVEQGMEVGELEVDTEALKKVLEQREQEAQKRPPQEALKRPCSCCDQQCTCGSGFVRRLCPHCRHKPCEAENNCGGPEALSRLENEALKRPLKPTEIPLKLPVRLTFGMEQPEMEAARIRRVPNLPPEALKRPCDNPNMPCTDPARTCPMPNMSGLPPRNDYFDGTVISDDPPQPPMPTPDSEARRAPPQLPVPPVRVGVSLYRPNNVQQSLVGNGLANQFSTPR